MDAKHVAPRHRALGAVAEIAELMEVPVGTVKSRLFRGRRQLQKVLYDYAMGYIPEAPEGGA